MPLITKQDFSKGLKIKREITYSPDKKNEYKSIFEELKQKEIIQKGTKFEDMKWVVWNMGIEICNFKFELPFHHRKWELPLKAWSLFQLKKRVDRSYIQTKINIGKEIINNSWGFSDVSGLTQFYEDMNSVKQDAFKSVANELLDFIGLSDGLTSQIRNIYQSKRKKRRQRQLPPYSEIVKFHMAVERLAEEWVEEEEKKYAPLVLWWRLTNILPMRPKEFVLTPYECVFKNGNDYFLRVKRTKNVVKTDDDEPFIEEVPITEEVMQWIESYKKLTSSYKQNEYLLCYEMHNENTHGRSGIISKNQMYSTEILRRLLDGFYEEIMFHKYGLIQENYKLKDHRRIQLIETRHLAICNMLFMNYSPHTIKVLAGHDHIHSQNPYAAHMDLYVQSQVTMLSESFQRAIKRIATGNTKDLNLIPEDLRNRRIYKIEDFSHLWPLPHGCFCLYSPLNCPVDDHRYCPFLYVPKENWEGALEWLTDCSDKLESEIKTTLDFLMKIRKEPSKRGESNNRAGKLNTLVHRKAMVDAQCKELEYRKWEE